MVVFGQKLLYSGKVAVFGKSGCIRVKRLYSDKVVVLGKVVVFGQKWMYSGKSGFIRAKWLY